MDIEFKTLYISVLKYRAELWYMRKLKLLDVIPPRESGYRYSIQCLNLNG